MVGCRVRIASMIVYICASIFKSFDHICFVLLRFTCKVEIGIVRKSGNLDVGAVLDKLFDNV